VKDRSGSARLFACRRRFRFCFLLQTSSCIIFDVARLEELTLSDRLYVMAYRFRSFDWSPGARLSKPLRESRVALISSAGLHLPTQAAFDLEARGGDWSYREIPAAVSVQELQIAHRSSAFDQAGARADRNLVFPLDRLREMAARREIGAIHHRHFSFMGSITAPGRLMAYGAPEVAEKLRQDSVDAVLLVPV
jgi:D-proline reductase (dithiol) PrdB